MDRPTSESSRPENRIPASPRLNPPSTDSSAPRAKSHRAAAATTANEAATIYRPVTLVYMAAIMLLMVPVLTLVDTSVARYFEKSPLSNELVSALELSLVFSHGTGVFLVLLSIMLLAPRLRWQIPRLATLALGGGALATITKMFVLRPRPSSLNLEYVGSESAWLWAIDWNLSEIAAFEASSRAFPSGNVVTATALTIGLWILLPRGRVLFATIWAGVLLQRLSTGSHFLSDACGGVAIGLLWAFVCYHPKLMGTLFDRMAPEPRRRRRSEPAVAPVVAESERIALTAGEKPSDEKSDDRRVVSIESGRDQPDVKERAA
ncbi:phosphatase PAP2 family protein [Aporhodopirellula aestuarii]|uniref:Phosphatase PAP2 family protein n=1 Tax=Aporhodopirellula aestuarii TaxID=2950107 RepID=A0ABT0U7N2_9BACT|nr:phosphatase PAP2 family protein [Aporhodopirellula aestuarii]MCM2372886.1 phosphatase PAP2 family protein [Aporhodopirellula aestuarii]